jgi:hypothetical protein
MLDLSGTQVGGAGAGDPAGFIGGCSGRHVPQSSLRTPVSEPMRRLTMLWAMVVVVSTGACVALAAASEDSDGRPPQPAVAPTPPATSVAEACDAAALPDGLPPSVREKLASELQASATRSEHGSNCLVAISRDSSSEQSP